MTQFVWDELEEGASDFAQHNARSGETQLSVWLGFSGDYEASLSKLGGNRVRLELGVQGNIDDAKAKSLATDAMAKTVRSSNTFNPIEDKSPTEIISLLEMGTGKELTQVEHSQAEQQISQLALEKSEQINFRDARQALSTVPSLQEFSQLCERTFLSTGDDARA